MQVLEKSNISYTIRGNSSEKERIMNCVKPVANEEIKTNCRRPCVSYEYNYILSHLRWPSVKEAEQRFETLKKSNSQARNWTLEDIYKILVKVQMYFSEFDVEELKQKPAYTWEMVPSDLGGLIGLYIGASVFSGLEVFSFLFSFVYYFCPTTRKRKSETGK